MKYIKYFLLTLLVMLIPVGAFAFQRAERSERIRETRERAERPCVRNCTPPPAPEPLVSVIEKDCGLFFVRDGNETLITADNYGSCPGQSDFIRSGESYGITWAESRAGTETPQIFFKKVDAFGASLSGEVLLTHASSSRGLPSIAWTGTEYGIAWQDLRDAVVQTGPDSFVFGNQAEIYFMRVLSDGTKAAAEIRETNCVDHCGGAELLWNQNSYYDLSWKENSVIYSAKLDSVGAIIP